MSNAPPLLFDRVRIARNLARRSAGRDDFVIALVQADLAERLGTLSRKIEKALVLGPVADFLPATGQTGIGEFAFERQVTLGGADDLPELAGTGYDLIVSLLDLQIVNDVPGYIIRLTRHLVPDGLLLIAALGGDSLTELRQAFLAADIAISDGAYGRVAPFIPLRDAGGLLQRAGLALPVADVETHTVRYANPIALMAEIKALGGANPLADRPARLASRRLIGRAAEHYADMAGEPDGRVRATLEILWLSGWAPHERQQQPLKPGSATVSMKTVLGDKSG